jgi:hypothetical protein
MFRRSFAWSICTVFIIIVLSMDAGAVTAYSAPSATASSFEMNEVASIITEVGQWSKIQDNTGRIGWVKTADLAFKNTAREPITDPQVLDQIKEKVAEDFKDPSSAQLRRVVKFESQGTVICGEVNAKNSYGAYVGFTRFAIRASADGALSLLGTKRYDAVLRQVDNGGCVQLISVSAFILIIGASACSRYTVRTISL